ncbi:MAG: hypothetical protein KAF27_08075 [Porphyrobacter sp.]|nr:hypothetical protein [Porphyrobacter sp.]
MDTLTADMRNQLMQLGILAHHEQEGIFALALAMTKHCAKTSGLPLGVAIGAASAKAGTVALPVIGTVSGATAGFLAGLTIGTASCVGLNAAARDELKKLAKGQ